MKPFLQKKAAPRTELLKQIDSLTGRRVIYILAPAGFGKTVSTFLWLEHREKSENIRQAWIRLDEFDNNISSFCKRFVTALASMQPDNTLLHDIAVNPIFSSAPIDFTIRALEDFQVTKENYILVVDDLHVIHNNEIIALLPVLFNRLPSRATFMLLSREAVPESFSEMVAKDELATINSEQLQLTAEEIKAYFEKNDRYITNRQANEIFNATGGWAIGVNALLLSGAESFAVDLTGKHLESYLKNNVWEKWENSIKNFMIFTSVAEVLSPELCDWLIKDVEELANISSEEILGKLISQNAFMKKTGVETYRFHALFREFLSERLNDSYNSIKKLQIKKLADWYFDKKDYYRSIKYYKDCGDNAGIAESLSFAYDIDSRHMSIEDTIAIIKLAVTDDLLNYDPLLLQVLTWAVCVEGRLDEAEILLDKCYALVYETKETLPPRFALMAASLKMMDHRLSDYEVPKEIANASIQLDSSRPPATPSFTYNLPFIHNCCCDFSEFAIDTEQRLFYLRKAWRGVFKDKYDIIERMIRAGIDYERSRLSDAHEAVLQTISALHDDYHDELQFSVYMLFAAILEAQGDKKEARQSLDKLEALINQHEAYYLNPNFKAFCCRLELSNGDIKAAQRWLNENESNSSNSVPIYMLYRYFTTVRAYIVKGDYTNANLLLKKMLTMLEKCKYRPIDRIETYILLAIVYWKKGQTTKGQSIGLEYLEKAIKIAYEYGYTQIFANEGVELLNMLSRLQKRTIQHNYNGEIPKGFAKTLYISALSTAKHSKGLTGGKIPENLTFTEKQKTVMSLMCKGLSRAEIADKMGLKPYGVVSHTKLIYKKLDVSSSIDAVLRIKELGVLEG